MRLLTTISGPLRRGPELPKYRRSSTTVNARTAPGAENEPASG